VLVVVDPNVVISALITPTGVARRVVQAGIEGRFSYVLCPQLLLELESVGATGRRSLHWCRKERWTASLPTFAAVVAASLTLSSAQ
jgi:PIN domain